MKNKLLILLLILSILPLTGCYDIKEIDETAYIVALGIDESDGRNFSYTFQFSAPLAISAPSPEGESSSSEESSSKSNQSVSTLTIAAPDFYVARNLTNNYMSKNINMSHLKMIVFSAKISPDDLEQHSQLLLREREIRPHTTIALSATTASDFLKKVNPELESNTSKYYELMSLRSNNIYAPSKQLHDFVDEIITGENDTVLPIATNAKEIRKFPADSTTAGWVGTHKSSIDSDSAVMCGMAIYKEGTLSGSMDGDSALIFNILNKNIDNCTVTVADKHNHDRTISFRLIIPQKAHYRLNRQTTEVRVSQNLSAEYLGSILPKGYRSFDELYSYFRTIITNRMQEFLLDISKERSADILSLRNEMRRQFLTLKDWEAFDWNSFYKQARFSVNINFI